MEFSEGGLLSQKREYLRLYRERLVFDICAAPFGKSYFYSMRFAEIPSVVKVWEILVALLVLFFGIGIIWKSFGFWLGSFLFILCAGLGIWFARNLVALGLQDLDAFLIKIPVIGPLYERFLRKETYHRIDTRLMYFESVNAVVRHQVDEFTSAKGIKLLNIKRYSPLGELYEAEPLLEEESIRGGDVAV